MNCDEEAGHWGRSHDSGAEYMRTCLIALRLARVASVMPFLIVWHPARLAQGHWHEILTVTSTAGVGLISIAEFWENDLFRRARVKVVGTAGTVLQVVREEEES